MKSKPSKQSAASIFSHFDGVYCTGFFMGDPALMTASSILFERVHILNHLEYVINVAKHYKIQFNEKEEKIFRSGHISITPHPDYIDSEIDPLSTLSDYQKETAYKYLYIARNFLHYYHELLPTVISTDLLPDGNVFEVELVEERMPRAKNIYRVKESPFFVSTQNTQQLNDLIEKGAIPFVDKSFVPQRKWGFPKTLPSRQAAALLGMESVSITIPALTRAEPEIILEARDRLRDHLPPFWAAMLLLSTEYKKRLQNTDSFTEVQYECQEMVDSIIRPLVIDLNEKMEKERKLWFNKILSPLAETAKIMMGKPPITQQGLIAAALSLGANISVGLLNKQQTDDKIQAGLTYLIELGKLINE